MNPSLRIKEWSWVVWAVDLHLDEDLRRDWKVKELAEFEGWVLDLKKVNA